MRVYSEHMKNEILEEVKGCVIAFFNELYGEEIGHKLFGVSAEIDHEEMLTITPLLLSSFRKQKSIEIDLLDFPVFEELKAFIINWLMKTYLQPEETIISWP